MKIKSSYDSLCLIANMILWMNTTYQPVVMKYARTSGSASLMCNGVDMPLQDTLADIDEFADVKMISEMLTNLFQGNQSPDPYTRSAMLISMDLRCSQGSLIASVVMKIFITRQN